MQKPRPASAPPGQARQKAMVGPGLPALLSKRALIAASFSPEALKPSHFHRSPFNFKRAKPPGSAKGSPLGDPCPCSDAGRRGDGEAFPAAEGIGRAVAAAGGLAGGAVAESIGKDERIRCEGPGEILLGRALGWEREPR